MRKRQYTRDDTGIDFTAILDIAFVILLLFFGATFFLAESSEENPGVTDGSVAEAETPGPPILLEIGATNLITIDGRLHERAALLENLVRLSAARPDAPLNITVHPDARTEVLAEVVEAARAVGIEMVSVETGEES